MISIRPIFFFKFPLKKSTALNFEQKVKAHGFADKYNSQICTELTRAREKLTTLFTSTEKKNAQFDLDELRAVVFAYLSILSGFMFVPCLGETNKTEAPLANSTNNEGKSVSKLASILYYYWSASVSVPHNFASNSAFYEAANVLINLAYCELNFAFSHLQTSSPSTQELVHKTCYAACCEAAGHLLFACDLISRFVPQQDHTPADSLPDFLRGVAQLAVAQAQEIGILRALEKERAAAGEKPPDLVAKLIHYGQSLYEEAHCLLKKDQTNAEIHVLLVKYAHLKSSVYITYTWLLNGMVFNKRDDNGSAMACAKQAKSLSALTVTTYKQEKKIPKEWCEFCSVAVSEADSKIVKFDRENTAIYHAKIPDVLPQLLPSQVLARPKVCELPSCSDLWRGVYEQFHLKCEPATEQDVIPASSQPQYPPPQPQQHYPSNQQFPPQQQYPGSQFPPSQPQQYPGQQFPPSQPQQYPGQQFPPSQPQQYPGQQFPPSQPQQYPGAQFPPSQPQLYPGQQFPPSQPQ